ncbi:hypothetical protein CMO96_04055 [Candidatus Woesebacteria bacterium]|nr:hypothetical protein [Candidatus Woesebacteria bacterium]|tara:strand:+ start:232 stop:921 length:690 start_codon:yes stop_codon:yes gene_type:complete
MKTFQFTPAQYKLFLVPALVFLGIVVLSITATRMMITRFFEVRTEISTTSDTNQLLETKRATLSFLNAEDLKRSLQTSAIAIPADNSTLFALSTVRNLAAQRGVEITNFRVSEKKELATGGAKSIEIDLALHGGLQSILSFVDNIQSSTPVMKVEDIKITGSSGAFNTDLKIVSIWGPLPEKLGVIESPIEPLKTTEKETLERLGKLKRLQSQGFEALPPEGRTDPFSF